MPKVKKKYQRAALIAKLGDDIYESVKALGRLHDLVDKLAELDGIEKKSTVVEFPDNKSN